MIRLAGAIILLAAIAPATASRAGETYDYSQMTVLPPGGLVGGPIPSPASRLPANPLKTTQQIVPVKLTLSVTLRGEHVGQWENSGTSGKDISFDGELPSESDGAPLGHIAADVFVKPLTDGSFATDIRLDLIVPETAPTNPSARRRLESRTVPAVADLAPGKPRLIARYRDWMVYLEIEPNP